MMLRQIVCSAALASVLSAGPLGGAERAPMTDAEFNRLHQMLTPQPGESRWMEIAWYPSVWEARRKAAEEGKPMFLMAGSGGAPAAGC